MWSSDRRSFLMLLAALPLAACGFAPAMAPGTAGAALYGQVALQDPDERIEFDYVTRLEERLGRTGQGRYRLDFTLTTRPIGSAITPTGAVTRYSLSGQARYSLILAQTGAVVSSGTVSSFTSWSASGNTLSAVTAEADAHRRLAIILADQTVARLMTAKLP